VKLPNKVVVCLPFKLACAGLDCCVNTTLAFCIIGKLLIENSKNFSIGIKMKSVYNVSGVVVSK